MKERAIHLLKKAKPIKALQLHKCIIRYDYIPDETILQMSKRLSRVKSLSLPDYALSQEIMKKYTLWLKYSHGLKKFNYVAPQCINFPDGQVGNFDVTVKRFFHEIRRDRINSLNISNRTADDQTGASFLKFKQYPSTLKNLAFNWMHYSNDTEAGLPGVEKSLNHMNDLSSVSLAFRNQAHLLNPILSSIKKFSQITSLSIEFLDNAHQDANLQFERLRKMRKLTSIKLKFDFWPQNFETFLKILEHCPLTEFYLDAVISENDQIDALKGLLSCLKSLESLTLKIYKSSSFENEIILAGIFEKISQIKTLKNLKLHIFASDTLEKPKLNPNVIHNLKGVFNKSVKIENFSFNLNQIEPRPAFLQVINLIERTAQSLRKLEIDVGEYQPEGHDYTKIIGFIQRLKMVENLKLKSLSLIMNSFGQDFIDHVHESKHLKIMEIRQIKGSLSDSAFVGGVEKILAKKGLQKFNCRLVWDRKEMASSRKRVFHKIDLKDILKRNPELQSYPEANGLFVYYDDDTEWKWTEEICA